MTKPAKAGFFVFGASEMVRNVPQAPARGGSGKRAGASGEAGTRGSPRGVKKSQRLRRSPRYTDTSTEVLQGELMEGEVPYIEYALVKRWLATWAKGQPAVKRIYKVGDSLESGGQIDLALEIDPKALRATHGPDATWETVVSDWYAQLSALTEHRLHVRQWVNGRDAVSGKQAGEADRLYIAHAVNRRENLQMGIFFLGFAALEVWLFQSGELHRRAEWLTWLVGVAAVCFFAAGVFSLVAWAKNWNAEETEKTGQEMLGCAVAIPFVAVAVVVAAWLLFSALGWLTSIPAWAVVIIVLLVLLLLKK